MRRRLGAKNMIRKTVGWCWNHAYIYNSFLASQMRPSSAVGWGDGWATNPLYMPVLNRVLSGWFNTRETFLAMCARFQTTSALTGNQHLWPQGGMRWKFDVTNVTNAPTKFKLYWCSLKCNDKGRQPGQFLANYVVPFSHGTANSGTGMTASVLSNDVFNPYWGFFDQSTRQPQTGDPPLIASNIDRLHSNNIMANEGVGAQTSYYLAPLPSAYSEVVYGQGFYNIWETIPNSNGSVIDADILYNERLTFTFPRMSRKLHIREVANMRVAPYATRSFSFKTKLPSELRPEQLRSDNGDNFYADVSGFFYLKAISEPVSVKVPYNGAAGGTYGGQSDYQSLVGAKAIDFEMFSRVPVALRFRCYQQVAVRSAFDGQPTFLSLFGGVPTAQYPASDASIFVGNQGFFNDGNEVTNAQALSVARGAPMMHPYSGPTGPTGFGSTTVATITA